MSIYHSGNMQSAYDRIARKYHCNRDVFDLTEIYEQLKAQLPATGRALDLGCGAGDSIAWELAQAGWKIDGVDFSQEMLQLAKKNNPAINPICCDMRHIILEANIYDVATSIYALFHIPVVEQFKLLEKVYHSLKDGGIFFFTYGLDNLSADIEKEEVSPFMDENLYYAQAKQDAMENRLKEIGYTILSIEQNCIGGEKFYWYTIAKGVRNANS